MNKEKPESSNIWEANLEDTLNQLEALGGKKACIKYLKLHKSQIMTTNPQVHESMTRYLSRLKEYYGGSKNV